jgi:tetratricopeptide (TPR) repeat protein
VKFQFQLKGEHLNSNTRAFENGYIEGDLQIDVEGQVYFTEPNVNVVELAIQLERWLDAVRHGVLRDFEYNSLDCDESIIAFFVQQNAIKLHSPIENFELPPLPIDTVKNAVLRFLVALHAQLHEMDYVLKLDRFLYDEVSENTKAITLFEQNEYDEAFALFKKLAQEAPSVQSINNLAWIVLREEEDKDEAERLLQQVLALQPHSPFPYMLLGEIALHKQQFKLAKSYLQQVLSYGSTEEATYNLAIAHFQLGEYEQAAQIFARCVGDSGMTQLYEVVSWMYAGKHEKAKTLLDGWNEDAYDYTGAIEIADVYVELGCYAEAREQFEKEWKSYVNTPYIVSRYAYTLFQLRDIDACQSTIQQAIKQTLEEMTAVQQEEVEALWTAEDKAERTWE